MDPLVVNESRDSQKARMALRVKRGASTPAAATP